MEKNNNKKVLHQNNDVTICNICDKNIAFLCEECLLKLQIDLIKQLRAEKNGNEARNKEIK
jgi:hypothetical protein